MEHKEQKIEKGEHSSPSLKRSGIKRGIYVLPSLLTTASLFCGFFSMLHSISGDYFFASCLILFSALFDALDGRLARLTKSQSKFGLEYDSLVDFVSFGVAPALLVFLWNLKDLHRFGLGTAFLFCTCGALRLARFNVMSNVVEKRFFQGLPIPLAAVGLVSLIIFQQHVLPETHLSPYLVMAYTLGLAFLMISSIRYRSFKQINFSKPTTSLLFLVALAGIGFTLWSAFSESMLILSILYITVGLVEEGLRFKNRKRLLLEKKLPQKEALREHLKVISIQTEKRREAEGDSAS